MTMSSSSSNSSSNIKKETTFCHEGHHDMESGRDAASSMQSTTHGLLSAVSCAEDKLLIIDVLNAIRMCRGHPNTGAPSLCTSWSVHPVGNTGYILTAYLPLGKADDGHSHGIVEVTHDDLSMIESVNLLRVRAGVAHLNTDTWALRIHITSHKAPVSFTVHDTLRFTQRRSLLFWNNNTSPASSSAPSFTASSSTANAIIDQGKSLFKNIFSKGEDRFSISRDNTNPHTHQQQQHHASAVAGVSNMGFLGVSAGCSSAACTESGRRKRDRDES